ncbi:MAG: Ig-like domain repeat protein [Terracidiphilus sp.]
MHPLAQSRFDRGAVSDSFPIDHVLLLLNRPPERDAALQRFLKNAHTPGSANFHKWITPDQFGELYGPADADVQTAAGWLGSHGFRVSKTSKSRQFVEFSGTAGSVREAFNAEIHQYKINGETHYANSSELKIPAALAQLVSGVSPMNDFHAKPMLRVLGQASYSPTTHRTIPQWTLPTKSATFYALAPEDVVTQYDLAPLYKAGVNGAGQTIGIINESNIDLSLVQEYQKLFGLSSATPQVIIDGSDPGTLADVSIEAYLDVEEASAIAPGAKVNLYIGNASGLFTGTADSPNPVDPLYLAALRAIDDNQAGVLSVSFGNCEGFLLAAGNSLWSALWQQAAAQGQTVLVSSGDSGAAGCDNGAGQWTTEYGFAVNGLASTPWNVAVGGTDFYYSDYATGGASIASLWNQTNDASYGSLKAPLPEQVWDTVYGFNAIGPYVQNTSIAIPAGGGGASGCINSVEATTSGGLPFVCNTATVPAGASALYGYAKPSWQTGTGVPSDGVRDIPDVSLFAANGTNLSGYPICAMAGDCVSDSSGQEQITLVGGTSASTPLMAAVMALVNQRYGRQGQADFTLYPLARKTPSAFHDITLGSNNMTCLTGSPGCSADSNGDGFSSLQNYSATPGYDLASGLGSIDASMLVNNWNSITFKPTTTTLQISPTTVPHGWAASFTINVNSTSGGGTPQGNVTILADLTSTSAPPLGVFTLTNGVASGALTNLPGGTYQVWAEYSGDGAFASSQSASQSVTIATASSVVNLYGFQVPGQTLNPAAPCQIPPAQPVYEQATNGGPWEPWPTGSSFSYWQVAPVAIVNGAWPNFGSGTGSVTFTVDGSPQATVALNSYGYAAWVPPSTFNAGTHTIDATYSGDASYSSSAATPYSMTVPQVAPTFNVAPAANCSTFWGTGNDNAVSCPFSAGNTLRVEVQISQANCHVPTGAITINLGSLSQNVMLTPGGLTTESLSFIGTPVMSGEAIFPNLPAGTYLLSATYAGDTNSLPTTAAAPNPRYGPPPTFTVVATAPAQQVPTTTIMSVNPPAFDDAIWLDFGIMATVTGPADSTIPPTGSVVFFEDGLPIAYGALTSAGPNSATVTVMAGGTDMDVGSSQLKAVYSGDSVYQSSAFVESYQFTINTAARDFLLAPEGPQLTVQPGSSGKIGFNLASLGGYSGTVNLTCAPSSSTITCSFNPSSLALTGQASTMLTVNVSAKASALARPQRKAPARWPAAAGALLFGMLFVRRFRKTALSRSMLLALCALAVLCTVSCGTISSSSSGNSSPPPAPAATAYSIVVTGTADGIVHNATITVIVP